MIRSIYVDDEPHMLTRFRMECEDNPQIELQGVFDNSIEALRYANKHQLDAAFLDISMPDMTGLELSERLREINHDIVIIFISAYDEYLTDAILNKGADYYLLKPFKSSDITSAIERASLLAQRKKKSVRIETFGRFNVYNNESPIFFSSKRGREILALLVNRRGTAMDTRAIWNVLFEDSEYNHYKASSLRRTLLRLKDTLNQVGIGEILESNKGEYRINTSCFTCDYYDFLKGDINAINEFSGEYMSEYSWAEETLGMLIGMCPPDHRVHKIGR